MMVVYNMWCDSLRGLDCIEIHTEVSSTPGTVSLLALNQ